MAIIIRWKRTNLKPANYNNIKVKDFCYVSNDWHIEFLSDNEIVEYVYKASQVDLAEYDAGDIGDIMEEVYESKQKIIRGKYIVPIYLEYCNAIAKRHHAKQHPEQYDDAMLASIGCKSKSLLQETDYYRVLSSMCPLLPCFSEFVHKTIGKYMKKAS